MADRYATNAFNNFSQFEKGVFKAGEEQTILTGDNPAFIWPPNNRRIAAGGFLPKDKDGKEVKGNFLHLLNLPVMLIGEMELNLILLLE